MKRREQLQPPVDLGVDVIRRFDDPARRRRFVAWLAKLLDTAVAETLLEGIPPPVDPEITPKVER